MPPADLPSSAPDFWPPPLPTPPINPPPPEPAAQPTGRRPPAWLIATQAEVLGFDADTLQPVVRADLPAGTTPAVIGNRLVAATQLAGDTPAGLIDGTLYVLNLPPAGGGSGSNGSTAVGPTGDGPG